MSRDDPGGGATAMTRYLGHVPGGVPAVRELAHLIVTKVAVGPAPGINAYVLRCRDTGQELLVDAAAEPRRILETCGEGPLVRIVTTSPRTDLWQALADVVDATGAATVAHVDDAPAIDVPTTEPVRNGDVLRVGMCELTVLRLLASEPGGIGLLYDDPTGPPHLWAGDSLGDDVLARADLRHTLDDLPDDAADLGRRLARLPDETWVYPAHGDDTTLGSLRRRGAR